MSTPTSSSRLWIRRFHPVENPAVRVVCLPHAGGNASFYFSMSAALTPAVETLSVQYPGRHDRRKEPCIESIPQLAEAFFIALLEWTDRPLALFGHSMGAILAFEVARRLEQRIGKPPVQLFASGRRSPSTVRDERVHTMDDERLISEVVALNGTDLRLLDDDMLRIVLPPIRSDYRAIENYRCAASATVSCPITVLTGDSDPRTTGAEAEAWRLHTAGEFRVETFSGGHFFLNGHQDAIVRLIIESLSAIGQ
jgi:pyochelin biosynthetic protein PchC